MSRVEVLDLAGCVLPETSPYLRDHMRKPERRTEHYQQRYDRRTLFYDCVLQDNGRLLFTAPPFLNLWPVFQQALPDLHKHRLRKHQKYAQVTALAAEPPRALHLEGMTQPFTPRADVSQCFAGLNCVVTMNKNNRISWILDWLRHHIRLHQLQGAVIFDNGSTEYSPQDLAEALSALPGLERALVVNTPYPYGTTDKVLRGEIRPNFLQPAMLNLARADLLRRARAVLNVDIDEMVLSRDGGSVFDKAAARPNRAVRLPVYWADPPPGTEGPTAQSAHIYRSAPKSRTARKWCVAPRGLTSRLGWHVHHVGGELFKLNAECEAHEVAHCRASSTGWNARRNRHRADQSSRLDPELARVMADLTAKDPA